MALYRDLINLSYGSVTDEDQRLADGLLLLVTSVRKKIILNRYQLVVFCGTVASTCVLKPLRLDSLNRRIVEWNRRRVYLV